VRSQGATLARGCHILVATPGRLKQFLSEGRVVLSKLRFFVLDEADRMLDMGFEPDVRAGQFYYFRCIVHACKLFNYLVAENATMPPKEERLTLMFSATFPRDIQVLARDFLRPAHAFITVGLVGAANQDIVQVIERVDQYGKKDRLMELIQADIQNYQMGAGEPHL